MSKEELIKNLGKWKRGELNTYAMNEAINIYTSEILNEHLPIDFIAWYSGMEKSKILKAYERYKIEAT